MLAWIRVLSIAISLVGLSGCHPAFTRVPDLIPRPLASDKVEWNYFDPLPDHDTGPTTDHRPYGFDRQRTMARRSLEKFTVIEPLQMPFAPPSEAARLGSKYPHAVSP